MCKFNFVSSFRATEHVEGETNPETLDLDIPGEDSTNKDLKPMVRIIVVIK